MANPTECVSMKIYIKTSSTYNSYNKHFQNHFKSVILIIFWAAVKRCESVQIHKIVPLKPSDIQQQLRFNNLYSQYRMMWIFSLLWKYRNVNTTTVNHFLARKKNCLFLICFANWQSIIQAGWAVSVTPAIKRYMVLTVNIYLERSCALQAIYNWQMALTRICLEHSVSLWRRDNKGY